MFPAIAEVICVPNSVPRSLEQLVEHRLALVPMAELGIRETVLGRTARGDVHVVVLPAHRRLDHLVEAVEADIGRDEHPPPHRRLRHPQQADLQLEDRLPRV